MKLPIKLKGLNLYRLLEVPDFSGLQEIKKGYRNLALKYHPDRHPEDQSAPQKFDLGSAAYKILMDDGQRGHYDRQLRLKARGALEFKSKELVVQRRKTSKQVYSQRGMVDHDFNRFVDECRANFVTFLNNGAETPVKPKFYSERNMNKKEYKTFVTECRGEFQDYLKSIPRLRGNGKKFFRVKE